jgi:hypothetical protein
VAVNAQRQHGTDRRLLQLETLTKDYGIVNMSSAQLVRFESECYVWLCFGGLCGNVTCRVVQLAG